MKIVTDAKTELDARELVTEVVWTVLKREESGARKVGRVFASGWVDLRFHHRYVVGGVAKDGSSQRRQCSELASAVLRLMGTRAARSG